MIVRGLLGGCAALGLVVSLASAAGAIDLTGTWEGRYVCQGFDSGGGFKSGNPDSVLLIVQEGTTFRADVDGAAYFYNGATLAETANPEERGEAVMNQCTTDPLPMLDSDGEIIRFKVKLNVTKGTGTLVGLGILETAIPSTVTCKYKYKRVSPEAPTVSGCAG